MLALEHQRQAAALASNGCFQALGMLFVFALPVAIVVRVLTSRLLPVRPHGHIGAPADSTGVMGVSSNGS